MKRRTLLLGGAAAFTAGGLIWGRSGNYSLANLESRPRLAYPRLIDATQSRRVELEAVEGTTRFFDGKATRTIGFNQDYLGPVIMLAMGETEFSIFNRLSNDISTHWHGLVLRGELDGGPHQSIAAGGSWQPTLEIDQPSSTPWFHTHIHERTAIDVYSGLAGGLIVSDGRDDERGIPSSYGEDDLYLVLQDKAFLDNGQLAYGTDMMSLMHGFTADTMVINGQVGSVAEVPSGMVRLRLLNGSNARIYRLAFSDGRQMHLIATDGGYLDNPKTLRELRLSPGERAEVLVDFSDQQAVALISKRDMNAGPGGMMGRFQGIASDLVGGEFEVLAFAPNGKHARIKKLPSSLGGTMPDLENEQITLERDFELVMGDGMMGRGMMGGGMRGNRVMGGFSINGEPFDMNRVNLSAGLGTIEKWTVRADMLAHPFHIHGVVFQVLSENGSRPRTENIGWKDTVLVENEIELLVQFTRKAPDNAPFMYHCHILEHEDGGMMGQFTVS